MYRETKKVYNVWKQYGFIQIDAVNSFHSCTKNNRYVLGDFVESNTNLHSVRLSKIDTNKGGFRKRKQTQLRSSAPEVPDAVPIFTDKIIHMQQHYPDMCTTAGIQKSASDISDIYVYILTKCYSTSGVMMRQCKVTAVFICRCCIVYIRRCLFHYQ